MATFTCQDCSKDFSMPRAVLDRYPGWKPRQCLDCSDRSRGTAKSSGRTAKPKKRSRTSDVILTTEEVLAEFSDGPSDGVFTDGSAVPNPGLGGWGAVYVRDGRLIAEESGHDPDTTNNRMELTAVLRATEMVPPGVAVTIYTDSRLVVQTINEWAAGWERRGWKRKTGPVENLDLVEPLYRICRDRPEIKLEWIAAHSGYLWNEYADALASRWRLE